MTDDTNLTECPLESLSLCMAVDPRDWSLDRRDVWMYAIVHGWGDAMDEIVKRHNWKPEQVHRLERLHLRFKQMMIEEEESK